MILAAYGVHLPERALQAEASLELKGIDIGELERVARRFRLMAKIQETTVEGLEKMLAEDKLPIAYIDRRVFELRSPRGKRHSIRDAIIHTVIPTRVTARSVTYHDPLLPTITRKTARLFGQAFHSLGGYCLVCSKLLDR
jgi:hypothetical protein